MAFLTKEECVRRHRLLWNYVADQILEQKKVPWNYKEEAFEHFGWHNGDMFNYCWACYYCQMKDYEIVDNEDAEWSNYCDDGMTLYSRFHTLRNTNEDWEKAARIAREIANMPVRENV